MERHIRSFNGIAWAGTDPGQCISLGNLLSLEILDFYIIFLNLKQHPCYTWGSHWEVSLENCLQQLVICLNSGPYSTHIVVKLLKAVYHWEHFWIPWFCFWKYTSIFNRAFILEQGCTKATWQCINLVGYWFCTVNVWLSVGWWDGFLNLVYSYLMMGLPQELTVSSGEIPKGGSVMPSLTQPLRNCIMPRKVCR